MPNQEKHLPLDGRVYRAAREGMKLRYSEVCRLADISPSTLARIESTDVIELAREYREAGKFERETVERLANAYRSLGVVFIAPEVRWGPGLRLPLVK